MKAKLEKIVEIIKELANSTTEPQKRTKEKDEILYKVLFSVYELIEMEEDDDMAEAK